LEDIARRAKGGAAPSPSSSPDAVAEPGTIEAGSRVTVGTLGLEGTVIDIHGNHVEVDVRGKRLRAALRDLSVIAGPASTSAGASADRSRGPAYVRRAGLAEGSPAVYVN